MALSKEDKGDVKKAMGKALANKVAKVTRDSGKWHSIGAGRVGDKYKGGIIKEMDTKNARAYVTRNAAKKYFYDEGVKNVGKEKTISGLKTAFKKHKPSDTYMGRPRRELDKEQGIGEFKGRYE